MILLGGCAFVANKLFNFITRALSKLPEEFESSLVAGARGQ